MEAPGGLQKSYSAADIMKMRPPDLHKGSALTQSGIGTECDIEDMISKSGCSEVFIFSSYILVFVFILFHVRFTIS